MCVLEDKVWSKCGNFCMQVLANILVRIVLLLARVKTWHFNAFFVAYLTVLRKAKVDGLMFVLLQVRRLCD